MPKKQIVTPIKHPAPTAPKFAVVAAATKPAPAITIPLRFPLKKVLRARTTKFMLMVVILLAACVYSYHIGARSANSNAVPTSGSLQTTDAVVQRVGRHILLPSGEQPTVATVTDVNKVRNQAFFAYAATGDKVLVYANAKKAYLYRPSIDRIIEVAPLAPAASSSSTQATGQ